MFRQQQELYLAVGIYQELLVVECDARHVVRVRCVGGQVLVQRMREFANHCRAHDVSDHDASTKYVRIAHCPYILIIVLVAHCPRAVLCHIQTGVV